MIFDLFDVELIQGGLVLATINLVAIVAISSGVLRVLMRQRALEKAWRLRMARWRYQVGIAQD